MASTHFDQPQCVKLREGRQLTIITKGRHLLTCGPRAAENGTYFTGYPNYGYQWTSTFGTSIYPWRRCYASGLDTVGRWQTWPPNLALPIRCVTSP